MSLGWYCNLPGCNVIIVHGLPQQVTITHIARHVATDRLQVHIIRIQRIQVQARDVTRFTGTPHRHGVGVMRGVATDKPAWVPSRLTPTAHRRCVACLEAGAGLAVAPGQRWGSVGWTCAAASGIDFRSQVTVKGGVQSTAKKVTREMNAGAGAGAVLSNANT